MEEMSIDFFDPKRTISYQLLNEGTTIHEISSKQAIIEHGFKF